MSVVQYKKYFWLVDTIRSAGKITKEQDDYQKNRNYWKYLKAKLRKEQSEVVSATTQLKLMAAD